MGGQKFSEPGSVKGDPELKENSLINGKHNPESHPSQDVSSTGGSHLVQGGGEEESWWDDLFILLKIIIAEGMHWRSALEDSFVTSLIILLKL